MELDIMWKSRIENKVLLRQMGAGLVDTKRVLINNGKIGHLEEGDRCRQLCLKLVTVLEVSRMSGTEACMG